MIPIIVGELGAVSKSIEKRWWNEKSEESELYSRHHCKDRQEYWEESWKLKETCCHSDSSEKPPIKTDVINSQGMKC